MESQIMDTSLITCPFCGFKETLEILPSFTCPKVIRITSVRGVNMKDPASYAKLLGKAEPTYIEPKAYMHLGFSRQRLEYKNMPSYKDMQSFALELAKETGFKIVDASSESRVILLSRLKKPIRFEHD